MKQTITKAEAQELQKTQGFDQDTIDKMFCIKSEQKNRQVTFSQEQVRQNAIRCLSVLSGLKQSERKRVLTHAIKLNSV